MVQSERGLQSGCVCPACGNACRDCMGSVEAPLTPGQLRARFAGGAQESFVAQSEETLREQAEQPAEWRKLL
jgi:hypothetical protein